MKNILLPRYHRKLKDWLAFTPLLAFDFDGTLVALERKPSAVHLDKRTEGLLVELSHRYPCVIITGRSVTDVKRWLGHIPGLTFIGNHGIEGTVPEAKLSVLERKVQSWIPFLTEQTAQYEGVVVENKRFSISVHYRNAKNPFAARRHLMGMERRLKGAKAVMGKDVVNLVPKGAPNKGTALRLLMKKRKLPKAIFLGDDVTDESVFSLAAESPRSGGIWGVRVGSSPLSKAPYFVSSQKKVLRLLELLIEG